MFQSPYGFLVHNEQDKSGGILIYKCLFISAIVSDCFISSGHHAWLDGFLSNSPLQHTAQVNKKSRTLQHMLLTELSLIWRFFHCLGAEDPRCFHCISRCTRLVSNALVLVPMLRNKPSDDWAFSQTHTSLLESTNMVQGLCTASALLKDELHRLCDRYTNMQDQWSALLYKQEFIKLEVRFKMSAEVDNR